MKITKVDVFKTKAENAFIRAHAQIELDGELVVKNLTVRNGKNGLYVEMPQTSYKDKDGKMVYKDEVFPVSGELRKEIGRQVLEAYEK